MKLRELLIGNFKTKVMALCMAIAVWVYAFSVSQQTLDGVSVPLVVRTPAHWTLSGEAPESVRVVINYPLYSEERIRQALRPPAEIFCEIDARLADAGSDVREKEFEITEESFRLPAGTEARIRPVSRSPVRLSFYREVTRTDVPVVVPLSDPPAGMRIVGEVWKSPQRVSVSGPRSVVAELKSVQTRRVRIDEGPVPPDMKIEGAEPIEQVVVVDGARQKIRCDERIRYTVYLARERKTRKFQDVPIRFLIPQDFRYDVKHAGSVRHVEVEITAAEALADTLKTEQMLVFVNVDRPNLKPGEKQYLPVNLHIEGVENAEGITVRGLDQEVPVEVVPRK